MLSMLRGFARSRMAMIIIGFLIVGLSAYALPNVFASGKPRGMISAGDRFVVQNDIDQRIDDYIRNAAEQGQPVSSRQEIARSGLVEQILQVVASETARLSYTDTIDLKASNFALADLVATAPIFRDQLTGEFDPEAYQQYVAGQNQTVRSFEQGLRDDITSEYLDEGLNAAIDVPESLARIWVMIQSEQRDYAFSRLNAASLADIPAPTPEELQTFYAEQQGRFVQPERRAVSVLHVSPQDFVDDVDLSEDDLLAEYEVRKADFSSPSTRTVSRILSADRSLVQQAADRIGLGEDFAAVAADIVGVQSDSVSLTSDRIIEGEIEEIYFAVPEGEVFGPVESRGQWITAIVTNVVEGEPTPFSLVKEQIRDEIARDKAIDLFYAAQEDFYDLIGGGLSLEEAGDKIGAPVFSFMPVDQQGRTADGVFLAALAVIPDASQTIFGFDFETQTSDLLEGEDSLVVARLDRIQPENTPALETIKGDVILAWRASQQAQAAQLAADALAEAARSAGSLAQAAEAQSIDFVDPGEPMSRRSLPEGVSRAMGLAILDAKEGDIVVADEPDGSKVVIELKRIESIDEESIPMMASAGKRVLLEGVQSDLRIAFYQGVQKAAKVQLNTEAIDTYISTMAGDQ